MRNKRALDHPKRCSTELYISRRGSHEEIWLLVLYHPISEVVARKKSMRPTNLERDQVAFLTTIMTPSMNMIGERIHLYEIPTVAVAADARYPPTTDDSLVERNMSTESVISSPPAMRFWSSWVKNVLREDCFFRDMDWLYGKQRCMQKESFIFCLIFQKKVYNPLVRRHSSIG